MKIKILYSLFISVIILYFGWMLCAHDQARVLRARLTANGVLSTDLSFKNSTANLSGQALVLYDLEHPNYPTLKIKRGHFQNNSALFTISLRGIQGNLFEYLRQTQLHSFKKQLDSYNPATDLLTHPFITLAILGAYNLDLDITLEGIKTAPNQITFDLIIYQANQQKIHFFTKLTPKQANASLFDNLKAQKLSMQLKQICPEWKQKLDDYSLSKNKPFITEDGYYEFSLQ